MLIVTVCVIPLVYKEYKESKRAYTKDDIELLEIISDKWLINNPY